MKNEWNRIFIILKVILTSLYPENIKDGFRILTYICCDYILNLQISEIEVCLSTISGYILQNYDLNIALGSIGLLWHIGSSLPCSNIEIWISLFKTSTKFFTDKRENIQESSLQTFFNLVNSYFQQFNEELKIYIIEQILHPLIFRIPEIGSQTIIIQGIIQCCQLIGNYNNIIFDLISIIIKLSLRTTCSSKTGDTIKSLVPLLLYNDTSIVTNASIEYLKIIDIYIKNQEKYDLQKCASVLVDVFPKIADKIDDNLFNIWIQIIDKFARMKFDKPFLHVATHSTFTIFCNIKFLSQNKALKLIDLLCNLMEIEKLQKKCIESFLSVFANLFNENDREFCIRKFIPYLHLFDDKSIETLFNIKFSLNKTIRDSYTIKELIHIGIQKEKCREYIIKLIKPNVDKLDSCDLNLFNNELLPLKN